MKKEKLFGIIALTIFLVSVAAIPQAYAKYTKGGIPRGQRHWPHAVLGSVSNPTGGCTDLGLQGSYGAVVVTPSGIGVYLQDATPNGEYQVLVGYKQSTGACDGTWQSVGAVNTNSLGNGVLFSEVSLPSGHQYVFELNDGGNAMFATPPLGI